MDLDHRDGVFLREHLKWAQELRSRQHVLTSLCWSSSTRFFFCLTFEAPGLITPWPMAPCRSVPKYIKKNQKRARRQQTQQTQSIFALEDETSNAKRLRLQWGPRAWSLCRCVVDTKVINMLLTCCGLFVENQISWWLGFLLTHEPTGRTAGWT